MTKNTIFLGKNEAYHPSLEVKGEQVHIGNEIYYKISNSNKMRPFFISLVSNSNHWMFVSSNGGLSAGRKNADNSFFPYYTDDKITESQKLREVKPLFRFIKR